MTEMTSFPSQIMHSNTAEQIIQGAEAKGDVALQQAVADSDEMILEKESTVTETEPAEEGRVDEEETRNKEDRERKERRKRLAEGEEELEAQEQGYLIDVRV